MSAADEIRFLEGLRPALDLKVVREWACKHYGLAGDYQELYSERDQNFKVSTADGQHFVFKISSSSELAEVIDFRLAALSHLANRFSKLAVPRVIPAVEGGSYLNASFSDGSQHLVHVLEFMPGIALDAADRPVAASTWRQVGNLIADVDIALQGFFHHAANQDHPWDLAASPRLLPFAQHIADVSGRVRVTAILQNAKDTILPQLASMRHQVIHQDAHDGNVLVDANDHSRVVGLIDFGDMLFGSIAAELALTCYSAQSSSSLQEMCSVVVGFDERFSLLEEEIDLVFDLIRIRHATTATIVAARIALGSDSEADNVVVVDNIQKINELEQIGRTNLTAALRRACRFPAY